VRVFVCACIRVCVRILEDLITEILASTTVPDVKVLAVGQCARGSEQVCKLAAAHLQKVPVVS